MKRLLSAIALSLLLASCSNFNDDLEVAVLKNNDGEYTCKVNDMLAWYVFETYEEAESHCAEWKKNILERRERQSQKWENVSK